jgi:hypothetical protein
MLESSVILRLVPLAWFELDGLHIKPETVFWILRSTLDID